MEIPGSVRDISASAFEGCGNLTLTVARGSEAEGCAKENDIKFTCPGAGVWTNG